MDASAGGADEVDAAIVAKDATEGRVCLPGQQKACACGGGVQGTQGCNTSGTGYLPCSGCEQNGADGGASQCTAPDKSVKALVATDVLVDFEGGAPGAISSVTPGGGWYAYQDSEVGTVFTPSPTAWMVETPGHGETGNAVHVAGSGFMGPLSATSWGAGTGFALGGSTAGGVFGITTMPTDVSAYTGISFYAKSSMMSDVRVEFPTPDTSPDYCTCISTGNCYSPHSKLVTTLAGNWTKYTVKFSDLMQPTYVLAPVPFDPTSLLMIDFASNGPVPAFDFWIDDITLIH